jgi:hypothetical protein
MCYSWESLSKLDQQSIEEFDFLKEEEEEEEEEEEGSN